MPPLTVILPVYNAAPFIGQAVRSILDQTFPDFELLIVDDGSTDHSSQIIHDTARADPRLRLIRRENRGLVSTLNQAISLAQSDLLARMDADDIALPTRFAKQLAFLTAHPEITVLGTQTESFTDSPGATPPTTSHHPTAPDALLCALLFRCPLAHPTVMLRRTLFTDHHLAYDPAAPHIEDYALWLRAADAGLQLANLPDSLLRYRIHPAQVCTQHLEHQQKTAAALQLAFIHRRLALTPTPEESALHAALAFNRFDPTATFLTAALTWLRKLAAANTERRTFPHDPFMRTLTGRFVWLARSAHAAGLPTPTDTAPFTPYLNPGALPSIN